MSKYRFDTSIFDRYVHDMKQTAQYQPVVMLANRKGKAFLVQCSTKADHACWSIVGDLFDATFLSRKDLEDFIISNNLHEWTEEDDRIYNKKLSNLCQNKCRIEL